MATNLINKKSKIPKNWSLSKMSFTLKRIKSPHLKVTRTRAGQKWEVIYPVSEQYNGLINIDGKLYKGFNVGRPYVPKGFKLESIGVGLDRSTPPNATKNLVNLTNKKYTTAEVKILCAKAK